MNTTSATTRTHRLGALGCATLTGTFAAVALGTPVRAMPWHSPGTGGWHDNPAVVVFTGGARPGAYLLVKTPMP
jgi:hypothetical protein